MSEGVYSSGWTRRLARQEEKPSTTKGTKYHEGDTRL
jgi:hypothetical protein